ncbi:hypothetical protein SUGI_0064070 [Cryptomeria japonica]|nr:hypothetical protein SUGI_0064070 [Cryptomeria japonica]
MDTYDFSNIIKDKSLQTTFALNSEEEAICFSDNCSQISMFSLSMLILIQWMIFISCFILISEQIKENGCFHKCGEVHIPYPFSTGGKGKRCGLPGFEINCKQNQSFGTTKSIPFLSIPSGEVQILNFSHDHLLINATQFLASTSNCLGQSNITQITISEEGPFQFSSQNKFVVIGCESLGMFGKLDDRSYISLGGCLSVCSDSPTFSSCNGDGCCQTSVPSNYTDYVISVTNLSLSQNNYEMTCNYAGILDQSSWSLISKSDTPNLNYAYAYISLNWSIPNDNCASAKAKDSYQCVSEAKCNDVGSGYLCNCKPGFHGDGYSNGTGCKDINECSDPSLNDCYPSSKGGRCENTKGSYKCSCAKGHGDGTKDGTRCSTTMFQTLPVAIGVCITLVAVLIGGGVVLAILKRRTARLVKQYNFQRNGGTHLQKLISSKADGLRIFSLDEVEKATQSFSPSLMLGSGGYATVYKGTLSDGFIVAVKKANSNQVDSKDIKDFINEIVILNQINHRNVVKLLGCCLETQLTEKSDVYSFGVVLVELLTGLKPVSFERTKNQSNLAIYFLNTMRTKDLSEILDSRLTVEEEANKESMAKVANLAKNCLSVEGEKRPTMKEVVQELLWIKSGGRGMAGPDSDAA